MLAFNSLMRMTVKVCGGIRKWTGPCINNKQALIIIQHRPLPEYLKEDANNGSIDVFGS